MFSVGKFRVVHCMNIDIAHILTNFYIGPYIDVHDFDYSHKSLL